MTFLSFLSLITFFPINAPSPNNNAIALLGKPAFNKSFIIKYAANDDCSAGLVITTLPVISAATVWPIKIATGKFQGLTTNERPFPTILYWLSSPVGPFNVWVWNKFKASFE